jgi:hemoglobin-like flavoprotein
MARGAVTKPAEDPSRRQIRRASAPNGYSLKHLKPNAGWPDIGLKPAAASVPRVHHRRHWRSAGGPGANAMTPEQILLVRNTFAKVEALGDRAAVLFYDRLFDLDPSLRPLFRGDLAVQRAKLMAALRTVIGALDRLDKILPAVRDLGRRHAHYGVEPEHYATVGSALIWTLEQGLGPEFTTATRRAWIAAYSMLAWTMVAAAEAELREKLAA